MKYKLVQRPNPRDVGAAKKWYANPVNAGKLTIKDFAKEISGRSSLTRGDVENVLSNFLDELPTFLEIGMSIQLGEFGTLRLSLSSNGVENPDDFDAADIKRARIIFTPGSDLKKSLEDIKFEAVK
jgi:predicted histone-like DNA-binding protein